MTPAKLRWGLLFITVGVFLILCNTGRLGWDVWYDLMIWWPLFLIALGIEKIFLKTKLHLVSYISPVLLVVAMSYVAVLSDGASQVGGFFDACEWKAESKDDVEMIEARINHKNVDLYVGRSHYNLIRAQFDNFLRKPTIEFVEQDGIAHLDVSRKRGGLGAVIVINKRHRNQDWDFTFSDETPLKLKCIGRNSRVDLSLQSVPLMELEIVNNNGDIILKVGRKSPRVNISVEGYDTDFRLKAPEDCGIKVRGTDYSGYLEALGFQAIENDFYSANYDSASVHLELDVDEQLRHLSIEFY